MRRKIQLKDWVSVIVLAILVAVLGILSKGSLFSGLNIKNLLEQSMQVIIGASGVIFIIAMGSTDLSIGGTAAVSATVASVVANKLGFVWFFPLSIGIGLLCGWFIGIIVTKCKVSSFMCTLAMLIALKGFLNVFVTSSVVLAPMQITKLNTIWFKVGMTLVIVIVMGYIFECTRFGRICKAMGENEQMVISMGVNVDRVRIKAYMLSGLMASFVGIFQLMQQYGSSATMGSFLEMKVMMAIFLGGVLVTGGFSSKVYKMIIGALMISVMVTGLYLAGVGQDYLNAVEGILLMVVLFMTMQLNKSKTRAD